MKPAWQLLRTQIYLIGQLQRDIAELHKKLDGITTQVDRDVICTNAYRSVARRVIQRRPSHSGKPSSSCSAAPLEET